MRFEVFISPFIERDLVLYRTNISDVVDFLFKLESLATQLKHFIIILVPYSIYPILQSDAKGKVFVSSVNKMGSNILFKPMKKSSLCPEEELEKHFSSFPDGHTTSAGLTTVSLALQNILYTRKSPIVVDIEDRRLLKNDCSTCGDDKLYCSKELDILNFVPSGPKQEVLEKFLKENEDEIFDYLKNYSNCSLESLKYSAFVQSFFEGMNESDISKISNFEVIPQFLSDIRKCNCDDLKQISYCGFLALSFPTLRGATDKKFKIDWHSESSVSQAHGVNIYRGYVLPRENLGLGIAGTKRLLIGEKNGKKKLLAYTDEHDFTPALIKARAREF